jgi:hypothetical protein
MASCFQPHGQYCFWCHGNAVLQQCLAHLLALLIVWLASADQA